MATNVIVCRQCSALVQGCDSQQHAEWHQNEAARWREWLKRGMRTQALGTGPRK